MNNTSPQLVMLCGIPTSGKTTYLTKHLLETECFDYIVLSTDSYIERHAVEANTTYNEVFDALIGPAHKRMNFALEHAVSENRNIVWDQTNLTPKARKGKLALIPAHYRKVAVWFDLLLEDALIRNQNRPGKVIPGSVLKRMFYTFTPPTLNEGFDQIIKGN